MASSSMLSVHTLPPFLFPLLCSLSQAGNASCCQSWPRHACQLENDHTMSSGESRQWPAETRAAGALVAASNALMHQASCALVIAITLFKSGSRRSACLSIIFAQQLVLMPTDFKRALADVGCMGLARKLFSLACPVFYFSCERSELGLIIFNEV